ncbi:hypothetical protein [Roseicella aerolata]|uniref:Uncharacterized protein n=1 Tax=Roseicella aerolata TaxID=2883479 RepID=A0A9X1LA79_9PROT|nr:hypothetical protein [Roseicella aerolata]MCB4821935.1 hypothetical protein [Roseicella aerolata]
MPMSRSLPLTIASATTQVRPRAVVAILADTEPAKLVRCLCALALQRSREGLWLAPDAFGVVVAPTGAAGPLRQALQGLQPALPFPVRMLPPAPDGHWALRAAMAAAGDWLGGDGPVLATTAEAVPEAQWVAHGFAALAGGADLALGEVVAPGRGPDAAARYAGLLATLAARLDPEEPAPAHGQEDAASFAIRTGLLARLGGLPAGPAGGLPGLLAALRRQDARIRHLPGLRVEAERPAGPVPAALAVRRRLLARRALRQFWADGIGSLAAETPAFRRWAARLGVPAGALGTALAAPRFGAAWEAVGALSPALALPLLPPAALPREMLTARLLLAAARLGGTRPRTAQPLPAPPLSAPAGAPVQRAGGLATGGGAPVGACRLRYPAGGWNRAGSCGP